MNQLYNVHVDDKVFRLTHSTINTYPNALLARIVDGDLDENDIVIMVGNNIYIDRDPKSFAYVIDKLRNYDFDLDSITDDMFKRKVIDDLDYFDLYCVFDKTKNDNDEYDENVLENLQDVSNDPLIMQAIRDQNFVDSSSSESLEFNDDDIDEDDHDDGYEMI
jgi:hypothetical protein